MCVYMCVYNDIGTHTVTYNHIWSYVIDKGTIEVSIYCMGTL